MVLGNTRRSVLKSLAAGTAGGIATYATTNSASAAPASFADGVNLQPSYYCAGEMDLGWDLMGQYGDIGAVRIEIEPDDEASLYQAKRWIEEASNRGYDVIATYHEVDQLGSSDPGALYAAADWWVDNYGYLSENAAFTINLMNEWGDHSVDQYQYADAYNDALSRVRDSGYGGPVICDAPGWGQNVSAVARAASEITDENVIFSALLYDSAYNAYHGETLRPEHLDELDNTGYPCLIGEFGSKHDGDADWSALTDHAKSLGWPVFGWAWNGDGRNMNMVGPYWGDDCTADSYYETSYFDVVYEKLDSGGGGGGGGGGGIVDGGTYALRNVQSGKALDVSGVSQDDGANVHIWDYLGNANQHWRVESVGNGYHRLVATHSGNVLDVAGVSHDDGANVHQWEYLGNDNQEWAIEDTGDGYRLTARHSGKVLDASGWDNGSTVHQWGWHGGENQRWYFELVDDGGDGGDGGGGNVSAPQNLRADDVGEYHITAVWDHVDGTDSYRLYYENQETGDGYSVNVSGQNYASATDLSAGTTYRLWVGAVVDGSVAEWSTAIDVTTNTSDDGGWSWGW
jgi:hypothetical protein